MYGCKSWTIKKAEHQKIGAFKLWCWRRLLRVPWTARILNQSILKEINPAYSLEGLMLKLKFQYFCIQSSDANRWLIGKVPDTRKDWGQKEKRVSKDEMAGWHHQCNEHELGKTPGDGEGQGGLECFSPWGLHENMIGQPNNNKKLLKTDHLRWD